MKVILQQDVRGQGKKGQMVEVSGGYGIGGAEESGNPLSGRAACRIYCRRRRGGMR